MKHYYLSILKYEDHKFEVSLEEYAQVAKDLGFFFYSPDDLTDFMSGLVRGIIEYV